MTTSTPGARSASSPREIVLREYIEKDGGYWQYWCCSVPPDGTVFQVLDSEWGHEEGCPDPVRYIYEWELSKGK
jgi:hypothetical protein